MLDVGFAAGDRVLREVDALERGVLQEGVGERGDLVLLDEEHRERRDRRDLGGDRRELVAVEQERLERARADVGGAAASQFVTRAVAS